MQKDNIPKLLSGRRLYRQSQLLPNFIVKENNYTLKFATSNEDIDAVLRLRFNVFNLEMGEGLSTSFHTLRDEDQYDAFFNHLIITENKTQNAIGTYRMQTYEMALLGNGFYSAAEFQLNMLPRNILRHSVELGRACIDKQFRNTRVLFLLWKGLANFVQLTRKRYLFGCCSLTSQNANEGWALYNDLLKKGYVNKNLELEPTKEYALPAYVTENENQSAVIYPPLLKMYLRYGAKVVGKPAIDREFKTIDYFLLLDMHQVNREMLHALLFDNFKQPVKKHRFSRLSRFNGVINN